MFREVIEMNIKSIQPNVRIVCSRESIDELCCSIRRLGQLEPIQVWFSGDAYRILDGEKRWRACKRLKMTRIKAIVSE